MTFQQLSFVMEVAKRKSFNKAAEHLYTHQSNVSNIIKQLEDELGIQIFQRTKKGVSITEEGQEFLSYADEIMRKKEFVEDVYAARNRYQRQHLRVSAMRSYFLSEPIIRISEYLERKDIDPTYIRLEKRSFSDVIMDVTDGRSDIGVLFLPKSQCRRISRISSAKNLDYFELGESRITIIMREGHPAFEHNDLTNITKYPYILAEETENFNRYYDEPFDAILKLFQKPPNVFISINEGAANQDLVAHTNAFFLSCTPWKHGEHYSFASTPLSDGDEVLSHFYIVKKKQHMSALALRYLEELKKMFQEL